MSLFHRHYLELRAAILNLKTGTSFKGIVYRRVGGFIVLHDAELITDQHNPVRKLLDGEVLVDEKNIDFVQLI
jgi:hypothetical protein